MVHARCLLLFDGEPHPDYRNFVAIYQAQVDKERKRIESAKIEYERLGVSLRNAQAALESLQQQPSAEATRKQLADKIKKLSLKRVRTNRLLEGYSAALVKCHALEAQPTLAQLQSSASLQAVETTIATRTDEQAAIIRDYEAGQSNRVTAGGFNLSDRRLFLQCPGE